VPSSLRNKQQRHTPTTANLLLRRAKIRQMMQVVSALVAAAMGIPTLPTPTALTEEVTVKDHKEEGYALRTT